MRMRHAGALALPAMKWCGVTVMLRAGSMSAGVTGRIASLAIYHREMDAGAGLAPARCAYETHRSARSPCDRIWKMADPDGDAPSPAVCKTAVPSSDTTGPKSGASFQLALCNLESCSTLKLARRVGNAPTSTRVWSPPHCLSATAVLLKKLN